LSVRSYQVKATRYERDLRELPGGRRGQADEWTDRRAMNTITASLLVTACVFAGGAGGLWLHRVVPKDHQVSETQEVIKLCTGMLSVLASLVLGLLIATAKTSYDTTDRSIRTFAAELGLLNETLRDYGEGAADSRDLLRRYTEQFLRDGWSENKASFEDEKSRKLLEQVRGSIRGMKPADDGQKMLQSEAVESNVNLLRQRWLLIEQQGSSVQTVVLGILVTWVTVIFASFGMNAPRNGTVISAFFIGSLAIGGAVFLILEMDQPLNGVMQISSWPVRNVLAQMNW
jgi:hypothetical protein